MSLWDISGAEACSSRKISTKVGIDDLIANRGESRTAGACLSGTFSARTLIFGCGLVVLPGIGCTAPPMSFWQSPTLNCKTWVAVDWPSWAMSTDSCSGWIRVYTVVSNAWASNSTVKVRLMSWFLMSKFRFHSSRDSRGTKDGQPVDAFELVSVEGSMQ